MNLISLRRNVGYKLLSLLIALVLYYVAYSQQNPRTTRDVLVQLKPVRLSGELTLAQPLPTRTITVSGFTSAINALKPTDVSGQVELEGVGPGEHTANVEYAFPPGVRGDILPQNRVVKVRLQKKESQRFTVDAFVTGTAPVGFKYSDGEAQPRHVTVRGPANEVARVARVVARVEAGENERSVQRSVTVTAEDSQKRVVDTVEIEPKEVTVSSKLNTLPVRQKLLVSVDLQGQPAAGYTVKDYRPEPDQVVAIGPIEVLNGRSSIEVTVDVTGIRSDTVRTVRLRPPGGVRFEGEPTVKVRLTVEPVEPPPLPPTPTPTPTPTPAASPSPLPAPRPSAGASPGVGGSGGD